MASFTFKGLTPGRSAYVHAVGRGGDGASVATGTVAGDGTLTVTLNAGDYIARDGRTQVYLYASDASDAPTAVSQVAELVVENGVPFVVTPD